MSKTNSEVVCRVNGGILQNLHFVYVEKVVSKVSVSNEILCRGGSVFLMNCNFLGHFVFVEPVWLP